MRAGGRCDDGAVERVSVVGNSGSGKTALARRLAALIDAPFVELDGHRHQAGWTELSDDDLRARVAELCAGDRWVVDGNYDAVRDLVWARADTVVWIDLPRWRVTARRCSRLPFHSSVRRTPRPTVRRTTRETTRQRGKSGHSTVSARSHTRSWTAE